MIKSANYIKTIINREATDVELSIFDKNLILLFDIFLYFLINGPSPIIYNGLFNLLNASIAISILLYSFNSDNTK